MRKKFLGAGVSILVGVSTQKNAEEAAVEHTTQPRAKRREPSSCPRRTQEEVENRGTYFLFATSGAHSEAGRLFYVSVLLGDRFSVILSHHR